MWQLLFNFYEMKGNRMKALGIVGIVLLLTACAGEERREDRREDRRSEVQTVQPLASTTSSVQLGLAQHLG